MSISTAFRLLFAGALMASGWSQAHVTRFVIESRTPIPSAGKGPAYELLRGHFVGEVDPDAAHNALITDLALAPRNARGRVEYSATFAIAKPVSLQDASGVLVYDVPNRGRGEVAADADGHVQVISGWQGDLEPAPGRQSAAVPVARQRNGKPVTGPALARFVDMPAGATTLPLVAGLMGQNRRPLPVSMSTARARLFYQTRDSDRRTTLPSGDWAFADCAIRPFPGTPDPTRICLRKGFDPARAYTLVYEGKDPLVLGLGFAATRDLNAFLRHAPADDAQAANPLAGSIRATIATGTSQSGNFLRSFLHLGFNADEQGRIVFDGINPHIAGRHVPLNMRFGVPGGASNEYEAGSEGPLWWAPYDDRVRGRGKASLLDRCLAGGTCPKIVETFGSAEFWGLRMSPNLVGTAAGEDIALPANVRRYYFPSVTHGGSWVGGFPTEPEKAYPGQPACTMQGNPNPSRETLRALRDALVQWVVAGAEPPPSRYPTLAGGELVAPTAQAMGWPAIPGSPAPDGKINTFVDYDFGRSFRYRDVSGVAAQPPVLRRVMPSLVPRVNEDGNETAGLPSVQLQVPLGTYTGWNEDAEGYDRGRGCGFAGGFIPFARTRAERIARNDPRLSLEERYGTHEGFVERVRQAVAAQGAAGLLRDDDAARLLAQARASEVLAEPGGRKGQPDAH
ncbi:alpha/beta hydrolase domain-containing protein [Massilia niastensis]|uniref:alpha/beta hydrolase domain-containing protein n=1 Tax=Massilia niastensis TaxID=544911 RepID=UPI0003AB404B|nr:alpha/beta hydrolase domain-containing protein [Massilia niastensis]